MRDVQAGDLVLHFYEHTWPDRIHEARLAGFSLAKSGAEVTTKEPPSAAKWAARGTYYRIPLRRFTPFEKPLSITVIRREYGAELEEEVRTNKPIHYPFPVRKDGVRLTQGRYLARCTQ